MRYIGIDIASENHMLASVDEQGNVLQKPVVFTEDRDGYDKLLALCGEPVSAHVVMEATGHYWQNVFFELAMAGFAVTLVNPLQTRRFAEVDLARTKTDALDALAIARFARSASPRPRRSPTRPHATCASSCACATAGCKSSEITSVSCTVSSTLDFPSSRDT